MSLYYKLFGPEYITGKYDKTIKNLEDNIRDFLNTDKDGFLGDLYNLPKKGDLYNFPKLYKLTQVNLKEVEKRLPELFEKYDDNLIVKALVRYPELQNLLYLIPSLIYTNGIIYIAKKSASKHIELNKITLFNVYKYLNPLIPIYRTELLINNKDVDLYQETTKWKLSKLLSALCEENNFYRLISTGCYLDYETLDELYLFSEKSKYFINVLSKNISNIDYKIRWDVSSNISKFNYLNLLIDSIYNYLNTNNQDISLISINLGRVYFLIIIYYLISNCNNEHDYNTLDSFKYITKLSIIPENLLNIIDGEFDKSNLFFGKNIEKDNILNDLVYDLLEKYESIIFRNYGNNVIDFSETKEKWINNNYTNLLSDEGNKQLKTLACNYMDNTFNTINDNFGIINTKLTDFFNYYNSSDYSNLYTTEE